MNPVRLSKFLSLALRHRACDFGLTPDAQGFVPFDALLALIQTKMDAGVARGEIVALAESGQPRRFELRGDLIRATYGHSRVDVEYPRVAPPEILYHGTHPGALASIRKDGLRAMKRQYVHLSTTMKRAREVASRRTREPVILSVRALDAHLADVVFHSPEPQHFLARTIAPQFIEFPEMKLHAAKHRKRQRLGKNEHG
jgi:putative RNA 2'-phosphotransferase